MEIVKCEVGAMAGRLARPVSYASSTGSLCVTNG